MIKERFICSVCGSEDIAKDAFATWNFEEQQFELHSTYDSTKCLNEDCEADDSGTWIKVEITYMLRCITNGGEIIDRVERFNTKEEAYTKRALLISNQANLNVLDWTTISDQNKALIKKIDIVELQRTKVTVSDPIPPSPEIYHSEVNKDRTRKEEGPVRIIDEKGVYPSGLDKAVEEQARYYGAGDLDAGSENQFDPGKRNFNPK